MNRTILHQVWRLADEVFRSRAASADQGDLQGPVTENIRLLAQAGLFGLGVATQYGGLDADEVTKHEYTEILASACGVTAFTQQQLHTGISFVSEARSDELKRELLPPLAAGRILCGIALSHLRRSGTPMVRAERVAGGYRLSGHIPWITGWSLLDAFVLGATLAPTGEHLYAYIDVPRHQAALCPGAPLPLSVMNASGTVEVTVRDLFVPEASVLNIHPAEELRRADARSITSHTALPLGCARGCAQYLRTLAEQQERGALSQTAMTLTFEIDHCRREALTWNCECVDHPEYKTYALRARASAIVLAMRAAHATVAATGGSAHRRTSVPQRLLREAQFYTTVVQTPDVQESTLDHLLSPFFGQ